MAVGRAFRINEKDIAAYVMPRRPRMRRLRKNPLGVTAIMGVANGRGARAAFLGSQNLNSAGESMLFKRNRKRRTAKQKAASLRNIKKAHTAIRRVKVRRTRTVSKKSRRVKGRHAYATVRSIAMRLSGGRISTRMTANRRRKAAAKRRKMPAPVAKIGRVGGKRVAYIWGAKQVKATSYKDRYRGGKRYIGVMAANKRRRRMRRNEFITGGASMYGGSPVIGMPYGSTYNLEPGSRMDRSSAVGGMKYDAATGKVSIAKATRALKRREALAKARLVKKANQEKRAATKRAKQEKLAAKKQLAKIRKQLALLKKIQLKAEAGMKTHRRRKASKKARKSGSAPRRRRQTAKQRAASLRNLAKGRRARKSGVRKAARRRKATRRTRKGARRSRKASRKVSRRRGRKAARRVVRRKRTRKSPRRVTRRRHARKAPRKSLRRNRRRVFGRRKFGKNFSFAALKAILPRAGVVLGGFVAHKFLTKLLGGLLSGVVPAGYSKTLVGAAVALGGFVAAGKFLPTHSTDIGLGMLASFAEGAVRELVPSVAPMLGLGASQSTLPRYSLSGYYEAAAGTPFVQAAAGEYFSNSGSIAQLKGAGEYFVNELQIQGSGDYEVNNNYGTSGLGAVIDGVRPDSNLDGQFAMMEASAGLGTTSPGSASTYIPSENAQMVGAGRGGAESGIFDQSGGNGVLS